MTEAEFAILSLICEQQRHGYELEQVIAERGMREWTDLAFSSIYFVLKKLEKKGLIQTTSATDGNGANPGKPRRVFAATEAGRAELHANAIKALADPQPNPGSMLLGLSNWPALQAGEGRAALAARDKALATKLRELEAKRSTWLPPHVLAIFDHGIALIRAEREWLQQTIKRLG